jgi:hypothetical protein
VAQPHRDLRGRQLGTVTSTPSGLGCASTCSSSFPRYSGHSDRHTEWLHVRRLVGLRFCSRAGLLQ